MGFWVLGLGFKVLGLGFRDVQRCWGLAMFGVSSLVGLQMFGISGLYGLEFLGFRDACFLRFGVSGVTLLDLWLQEQGFGLKVRCLQNGF